MDIKPNPICLLCTTTLGFASLSFSTRSKNQTSSYKMRKVTFIFLISHMFMVANGFSSIRIQTRVTTRSHSSTLHMSVDKKKTQSSGLALKRYMNHAFSRNSPRSNSAISSSTSLSFPSSSFGFQKNNILKGLIQMNETSKWRLAAATFITSIFIFSSSIDVQLIRLWNWLQNDTVSLLPRLFRHDHWEWMVAVWAFFFWIHGFWLADRAVAKADIAGRVHPWKKYRLQDQYEAEKFRRMQARKLESGGTIDTNSNPPVIEQSKWHLGFWTFELPLYVLPLYIWDICIPRRAAKIAAWGAPTALGICKDVTCALLLYDLGFFVCHYLMHKIPFLYKYVHSKHHINTEVRASDIVRLSFVEEIVDVGISILALNYLKAHPVSRTIYNIIITFLLTELHSGFNFPWTPQNVIPFGLATGSKGHHYHHRNGEKYYQKFFCHVDRLFGFVQKKDGSLKGYSV